HLGRRGSPPPARMAELTWHPGAVSYLEEACAFIAEDSPAAARVLAQRVTDAVSRLATFPQSGRVVPESEHPAIRECLIGPYRVVYRLRSDVVQIVMVHHSARLLTQIRPLESA